MLNLFSKITKSVTDLLRIDSTNIKHLTYFISHNINWRDLAQLGTK